MWRIVDVQGSAPCQMPRQAGQEVLHHLRQALLLVVRWRRRQLCDRRTHPVQGLAQLRGHVVPGTAAGLGLAGRPRRLAIRLCDSATVR